MATERKTMALGVPGPVLGASSLRSLIPKHRGEYAATSPRPGGGGQTETPPVHRRVSSSNTGRSGALWRTW